MKFHDVDKLVSMKFLMARFVEYDSIVLCVTQVRNRMTLEQMLNVIKDMLGSPKHQKIMSVSIVLDQMPRSGKVGQQEFRPIFVFILLLSRLVQEGNHIVWFSNELIICKFEREIDTNLCLIPGYDCKTKLCQKIRLNNSD